MYESYYGFKANPFRIAPDPSFFFASAGHKRGLAYLRYGLHQGQGFVVVTGEPGTGKTILIQTLLAELSRDEYCVATITNTNLRAEDVLRSVAENFGIDQRAAKTKAELLGAIQQFLEAQHQAGRKSLLIVDEAQNLPPRSLEELRMLSNFQIGHDGLLQIVLAAQPQLRKTLAAPSMEQLSQRIIAGCHLKPISAEETRGYIAHRLKRVGWGGSPSFSGEALSLIYGLTRGIPRLINILSDRVLLAACMEERDHVDRELVANVLAELKEEGTGAWVNAEVDDGAEAALLDPLPGEGEPVAPSRAAPAEPAQVAAEPAAAATAPRGEPASPPVERPAPAAPPASAPAGEGARPSSPPPVREAREKAPRGAASKVRRTKPKIVKAVARPGQEGEAAQLVQVKWNKEQAAKRKRSEAPAARGESGRPPRQEPRMPEEGASSTATPRPEAPPSRQEPAPAAKRVKRVAAEQKQGAKVIELPVAARGSAAQATAREEAPVADQLDELFEPVPPPADEAPAAAPLDDELFGPAKGSDRKRRIMTVLAAVVVAGGLGAFLLSPGGGSQIAPDEPAAAPAPAVPAAASAPTPPPAALEEGERGSIFDPRARVPAASSMEPQPRPQPPVEAAAPAPAPQTSAPAATAGGLASAAAGPDALPEWELADLMYTFILAFENGNTSLFSSLFTGDADVDGHLGRDEIGRFYSTLFSQTEMRSMSVDDIRWSMGEGGVIVGEGGYETTLWYGGREKPEFESGRIELEVVRRDGRLLIRRAAYL